jgi:hypothetical protein
MTVLNIDLAQVVQATMLGKGTFLARRAPFCTWHLGQPELAAGGLSPAALFKH